VTQLDPVALHLLHRDDPIDRPTLSRIVGERSIGLPALEKGALIAAVILAVALIVVIAVRVYSGMPFGSVMRRSTPALYLFMLPFIIWGGARKKRFGQIAATLLKHCRCPHCGYDLRGLAPMRATARRCARNADARGSWDKPTAQRELKRGDSSPRSPVGVRLDVQ
jgi:hypothetical protein